VSHSAFDQHERRGFVADPDVLSALDMSVADLADPDARSFVIRHEHPELEDALTGGLEEIDLGYGPINPRLHLAMHEIVATQLWDGNPHEVWETALRLRAAGYERHEVLHMLGRPMSDQIWAAFHDEQPYDRERHVAALRALPGSWERERSSISAMKSHSEARKRARRPDATRGGATGARSSKKPR
jgi:hypothetical protein